MIWRWLLCRFRRQQAARLHCSCCGVPIHRHDRYIVERVHHIDCHDPKLVGQGSLAFKEEVRP